jgi:hypothetical protein
MKTLQSTLSFNEFSFSEHTRHLQLVYYKSHLNQPSKKRSAKESIFYEAQWNFLIHNKVLKWARSKNSSFCPFLSNEKQGTSKINKIKITKIWEELCIKPSCRLWFCHTHLQIQKAQNTQPLDHWANFQPREKSAMKKSAIECKNQPLNIKLSHGKLRTMGEISYGNIIHST